MVQSKIKINENNENGVGESKRRSTTEVDHWSFLEEFEAPMWVDLSLEPKLLIEDKDDSWFHTSHPFHHHSARHLRSAFAHPDVGNDLFNVNLQGACSPHLPSSVSKSRGKDYCRDGRSNCGQISLNTGHPISDLGDRISIVNSTTVQECKAKVSRDNSSEASSLITGVVDGDSERKVGLNSESASTSGISSSTITTVSLQQDLRVLEVPKEGGNTASLLNALRTNLRKSRATRPASRVEIIGDREPKDRKSSAGKSSVGSSSIGSDNKGKGSASAPETDQCKPLKTEMNVNVGSKVRKTSFVRPNVGFLNPKIEVKKTADCSKQNKNRNTNVRDFRKSEKPVNGRVKDINTGDASVCARNNVNSSKLKGNDAATRNNSCSSKIKSNAAAISSSKVKGNATGAGCSGKNTSKSKVLLQTTENSLNKSKIGFQGAKGKVGISLVNESACSGKENMRGRAVLNNRSGGKNNMPVVSISDHKVSKLKSKNRVGVPSVGSKVRTRKMDDGTISMDTRIHLR